MSVEIENEKSEVLRRSIPFGRIGELASTADSTIWPTDVSSHYAGRGIAADKAQRIRAAAAKLIDLYDSVVVKPNWRSGRNVRTALAKLAEIREAAAKKDEKDGAQPATAPWKAGATGAS
jgi:murein L,D-transpeptidase YcbB/YkuD